MFLRHLVFFVILSVVVGILDELVLAVAGVGVEAGPLGPPMGLRVAAGSALGPLWGSGAGVGAEIGAQGPPMGLREVAGSALGSLWGFSQNNANTGLFCYSDAYFIFM